MAHHVAATERDGGRTLSPGSYNGPRLNVLLFISFLTGRTLYSFCFYLFISFLHFKIVFVYFYATAYRTRSCIHKITCLTIEHTNIYNFDSYIEIIITGTKPVYSITRPGIIGSTYSH